MDLFDDFNENFELLIKKFKLSPTFEVKKDGDRIMVTENWVSNKYKSINANKIYEFDSLMVDIIPTQIRDEVLKEILEIYIQDERYEEAAILRDILLDV